MLLPGFGSHDGHFLRPKKSKNRFEVGMETLTNYMEAQAQWQKAWSDWIEAKAELRVNETYYLKSTGRLSD